MAGPFIVGTPECSVRDVAEKLRDSDSYHLLKEKWSDIARDLDLPDNQISVYEQQLTQKIISSNDIVIKILHIWVEHKEDNATLDELLDALKSNRMRSLAEELEIKIGNRPTLSQQGKNSNSTTFPNSVVALPESIRATQPGEVIHVGSNISYFPGKSLGWGFMGSEVYEGRYEGKIQVAVKQLKKRFHVYVEEEVNLLCQANTHDNVIRYYCSEVLGAYRYIALELCQATLKDWVEKTDKGMEVQNITDLKILQQCVDGLMFIHEKDVVHRDLRPSNILLFKQSKDKIVVKISDFGFAKAIKDNHQSYTHSGSSGSLGWIAPEVTSTKYKGKITAGTVDIFSLGCIFYNVITRGGHPFEDKNDGITRQLNIKMGQFTISSDIPYNSRGMTNLIKQMINSAPEKRPPLRIVKSHPMFWEDTDKVFRFFGRIKSIRSDKTPIVTTTFQLLEKLARDRKVLGDKGFIQTATKKFDHDFRREGYKENAWSLIRALRNYGPEGHKSDNITPASFRLPREAEYVNYWLNLFPKLLPCAWIAFKGLADAGVEGFEKFYGEKGDPFWETDACRDLI